MKQVAVQVRSDHLEGLARARSAADAIAELIWNGLDADAKTVEVSLVSNGLSGIDAIVITDDGHGLAFEDADAAFSNLGGSWKRSNHRTPGGRIVHGHQGRGRFKTFALGGLASWTSRYRQNGSVLEYEIRGSKAKLNTFEVDDPEPTRNGGTGMRVEISNLAATPIALELDRVVQALTETFALYLRRYPVCVTYDGQRINPAAVEDFVQDYPLQDIALPDGRLISAELTVIEWKVPTKRALYLCNAAGFALSDIVPGIQAPGFDFTAYLKSEYLQELDAQGFLMVEDLHPGLRVLLDAAKTCMRDHFRGRAALRAGHLVEEWKAQEIYPYRGDPRDPVEAAERQVFDVVALNVHSYLPDFDQSSPKSKRLAFHLLKEALETSPGGIQRIIQEVLDLPTDKREELLELLKRTSLEAIIGAAKTVADRLEFLVGLETLVFEPEPRKQILERRQLHRIIADETWIFGEQFNLAVDDESLTAVLKRHLAGQGIELGDEAPVLREDGSEGIVDLMLSRRIPLHRHEQREHLVVELKRPTVKFDSKATEQLKSYAFAIASDERFKDTETTWHFWGISTEMSESVRKETRQRNRPEGLLYDDQEGRIFIWVRTWAQLLEECRGRLTFFQERLQYLPNSDAALDYLRKTHARYLPPSVSTREE